MNYRNYLVRKSPSTSFFFLIKIPKDLRVYFGRNQFKVSLKNGIRSESVLFSKILFHQVQSIFEEVRMGSISKITVNQIKEILKDKIDRTLIHSQHIVSDTNTFVESEVKKKIDEINDEERLLRTQVEENYEGVLEHIEKEIDGVLKRKDLTIDIKSLEFKELRKQFLELRLLRNNWKKELLEDSSKSVEDFKKEIYKRFNIKLESISNEEVTQERFEDLPKHSNDNSPKISEVKDEFIRERTLSGFSPKSTRELKSTIEDFIEIVGNIKISQVTHKHSREFKNIISRLPKHRTQTPRYRDLTIKQILNLENVEGQEPKNINKLIYRVRIFFKWLKNNYREYVPENYFEGISVDIKNFKKPRDGFTDSVSWFTRNTKNWHIVYNWLPYSKPIERDALCPDVHVADFQTFKKRKQSCLTFRMVFQYPKYVRTWEYIQINTTTGRNRPFPVYLMYFPETLFGRSAVINAKLIT